MAAIGGASLGLPARRRKAKAALIFGFAPLNSKDREKKSVAEASRRGCCCATFRYTAAVNCLTKQEVNVLILILGLLITGWAVRSYRAAHPPVVAAQQFKP